MGWVTEPEPTIKTIYMITYPNGKIYVGKDLSDNINYFGSANPRRVANDFTRAQRQDFTLRKRILWESATATDEECARKEVELILHHRANNPSVGYNQRPVFRGDALTLSLLPVDSPGPSDYIEGSSPLKHDPAALERRPS